MCKSLVNIDLSKIDTSEVRDMSEMFSGCESVAYIDISKFNIGKVERHKDMFKGCKKLRVIKADEGNYDIGFNYNERDSVYTGCENLEVRCSGGKVIRQRIYNIDNIKKGSGIGYLGAC